MTNSSCPIIVVPGAGGEELDPAIFATDAAEPPQIRTLRYPGWRRYVGDGFAGETLIADLAAQAIEMVPDGPIYIVGYSIGGHFGYALAQHLQAAGRDVQGFCAIDSFMINPALPDPQWKRRVRARSVQLLRDGRIREFARFLQSLLLGTIIRMMGGQISRRLRSLAASRGLRAFLNAVPSLESEIDMRLLIRSTAPWLASLDQKAAPLKVPASLIRGRLSTSREAAWKRRCPDIEILETSGHHFDLFDADNIKSFRAAFRSATQDWRTKIA
ncbi:MAG TPA: alpha/beta fold hydrolase [Xanthobacteraceae bacterium]|jgi:thioesterase domain-containing protein|nr:alpha/beta fold hydrolase [Xanthobacteraceae bacterium]